VAVNVFDDAWEGGSERDGYASRRRRLGPQLGAERLGATLYELGPGERICPYHYEFAEEEWVLVVTGMPTLRMPEGERTLQPWDVVACPLGAEGAHEVRNDTGETVVVMMLSNVEPLGVVVYPDSGKVSAYAEPIGGGELVQIRNRIDANLDYFDGEA
jgi:uncharacterized cupin superfamily protein